MLEPGQHFEGLEVVSDPVFHRPKRKREQPMSVAERAFTSAVDAAKRAQDAGFYVTPETIRQFAPSLPQKLIIDLLQTERFRDACDEQGVALGDEPGLSPEQVAALRIYLDTSTPATHRQKLSVIGVSQARWEGWLRQPLFAQRLSETASQLLQDSVPMAMQRVAEAVDKGERWAIEMSLEMTGTHDRRGDGVDVRSLLHVIYTVLDEEVRDSSVLERIAAKIKQKMGLAAPQQVLVQQPAAGKD